MQETPTEDCSAIAPMIADSYFSPGTHAVTVAYIT